MAWQKFSAREFPTSPDIAAPLAEESGGERHLQKDGNAPSRWAQGRIVASPLEGDVLRLPSATLATVEGQNRQSVASVATVAGVHADMGIPAAIPPDEVAVLFERIVTSLMTNEIARVDAEIAARPILRARIGNDARLAPPAGPNNQCSVCGEPEGHTAPLLPILSARSHGPVWLHRGGCHARYRCELAGRVEQCIRDAGLPDDVTLPQSGRPLAP